jgi:hypothetical protein
MSTTFCYEQDNGEVYYIQTRSMTIDEAHEYLISRIAPGINNQRLISKSIVDYFNNDSNLSVLYMLDGTIKLRRRDLLGEFIFLI